MKDELEANVVYTRDAPTKCEGRRYQLAAGEDIRFASRTPPFHRKQFVITNRDADLRLQLRVSVFAEHAQPYQTPIVREPGGVNADDVGPIALTVYPESIIGLFTSDSVWVRNANAGTVELDVLEIWYT